MDYKVDAIHSTSCCAFTEFLLGNIILCLQFQYIWVSVIFIYPASLHNCRKGSRLGHDTLVDGMLKDGLWDVYNDCGMGVCAELCAENHNLSREDQVCVEVITLQNIFC